jgi:hypothetical protein
MDNDVANLITRGPLRNIIKTEMSRLNTKRCSSKNTPGHEERIQEHMARVAMEMKRPENQEVARRDTDELMQLLEFMSTNVFERQYLTSGILKDYVLIDCCQCGNSVRVMAETIYRQYQSGRDKYRCRPCYDKKWNSGQRHGLQQNMRWCNDDQEDSTLG